MGKYFYIDLQDTGELITCKYLYVLIKKYIELKKDFKQVKIKLLTNKKKKLYFK